MAWISASSRMTNQNNDISIKSPVLSCKKEGELTLISPLNLPWLDNPNHFENYILGGRKIGLDN